MPLPVIGHVGILTTRADGFVSAYAGERFIVKNPTPGTGVTGHTSLTRTTPLFSIHQTDQAATPPTEFTLTLASLTVSQVGTVAGGTITILVCVDSTNRYSAGGTALTPQTTNIDKILTPGFSARSLPTLSADGTTDRDVFEYQIAPAVGACTTVNFKDIVRCGKTGTIFVFAFAATTAPTLTFCAEVIEGRAEI